MASVREESTRESRITRLYSVVQRLSATPAPDRFTAASTPSSWDGSSRPAAGSHSISSAVVGSRRTSRSTSCPSARSRSSSAGPTKPDAPLTTTFTARAPVRERLTG